MFGIKSVIVLKNNLIANPSTTKKFLRRQIKTYSDEVTDFHKKIPRFV